MEENKNIHIPPVPDPGLDEAARLRSLDAARKRRTRYRQRLVESIWAPRGNVPHCDGSGKCDLSPVDDEGNPEPCECRPGYVCMCGRRLWKALLDAGKLAYGPVVAGLVARSILDLRDLGTAKGALDARMKLIGILLTDQTKREDLGQRAKRLDLEARRIGKPADDLLAKLLAPPEAPARTAPVLEGRVLPTDPSAHRGDPATLPAESPGGSTS